MSLESKQEKEYDYLRREMEIRYGHMNSYNIVMITATATILGFSITQPYYGLSLIPLIIIVSTFINTREIDKGICKIGAYLNVFLEGEGFNWERRCHLYDRISKNSILRFFNTYYALTVVCVMLSIYKCYTGGYQHTKYRIIGLLLIGMASIWLMEHDRINFYELKQKFIDNWANIKTEELNKKNNLSNKGDGEKKSVDQS